MKVCKKCGLTTGPFRKSKLKGKIHEHNTCRPCEKAAQKARRAPDARPTVPEIAQVQAPVVVELFERPLRRVLFIPDSHIPFHDVKAFDLMLRAAEIFRPDTIVVLGDFADFYSVSAHDKNPTRVSNLEYEVGIVREKRAALDKLGASRKIFIEGNHEFRLARYLASNAPAVFKMLTVPELFQLPENGWEFVPYKTSCKLGKLHLTHDTGTAGQNAHRQSMNAFQGSTIIGHTHRMEFSVMGNADGPPQVGAMFGWLGGFEDVDYLHAITAKRNWVHGFGIGHQEASGVIHLQPIPIVNGTCCVLGQLVK